MKNKTILFVILSTCGLIFISCSLCPTQQKQTTKIVNKTVSLDTLKSRFELEIIKIDSLEYNSNKVNFKRIDKLSTLKKENGIIKVPTVNTTIEFRDNTSDENLMEYSVVGQNSMNKWILILGQDYNQDYYYLVNQEISKIDTLVGNPMIFGNKLLCQEGSYTDGTGFIEIWNSKNGKLELEKKFSLKSYNIFANEIYLKDNTVFVKYESNKYLKIII